MTKTANAKRELYKLGNLSWLLREAQLSPYQAIKSKTEKDIIACLHRGAGKTFLASLMVMEHALKFPNSTIHYCSISNKFVERIVLPNIRYIVSECGIEKAPRFVAKDSTLQFPNGSRVFLYGADNLRAADSGRGVNCDVVVIDERGFIKNSTYLLNDVLAPRMTLDTWIMSISTPATSSSHPFNMAMLASEGKPNFFRYTIDDNPSVTPEMRARFVEMAGGEDTSTFRREYLCSIVTDKDRALFPTLVDSDLQAFVPKEGDTAPKRLDICLYADGTRMAAAAIVSTPDCHILADTQSWQMPPLDKIEKFVKDLESKHGVTANVVTNADEELRLLLIRNAGIQATPKDARNLLPSFYLNQALILGSKVYVESLNNELHQLFRGAIWNPNHTSLDDDGRGGSFESVKAAAIALDRACKNKTQDPQKAYALKKALFGQRQKILGI